MLQRRRLPRTVHRAADPTPGIDFESGVIHIWRARRRDATGRSIIADPKTTQSVRSLTAPEPVLDSLRRHRREQVRHRLEIGEV